MEVTRNCAVIAYGEYGRDDASHDAKIVLADYACQVDN